MAQYQTFPGAEGASRTLDKLKALKLPVLEGRSFLDVGCNEGFFCGFAAFLGASRVVGVDRSSLFLDRAKARFPGCEFLQQAWDHLPDGQFDVILLASALHYADDQPALIRRLVERLSPDGMLVLELGIVSDPVSEWVTVDRGIDTRLFPTMPKLREILADYAWKWMGPSVDQAGDPIMRHVVHVSRRRPLAYLLMQPPGFGKSSIASRLFDAAGVRIVSGDQSIAAIAKRQLAVSSALQATVAEDYSPFRLDQVIARVLERGLGGDLVDAWTRLAGPGDFALDMFIPVEYQQFIVERLTQSGYLPVHLGWERVGPALMPAAALAEQADLFCASLGGDEPDGMDAGKGLRGFVDDLGIVDGRLRLRGWAIDAEGRLPDALCVRINGQEYPVPSFEAQARPDVQRHLRLAHAEAGYALTLDVPGLEHLSDIGADFAVTSPAGGRLRLTGRVRQMLRPGRTGTGGAVTGSSRRPAGPAMKSE
ncbi:methyltransferase domain-containing protein [Luteimonas sp. SDU82]|uniref:class I SAM-dependent methyltransferase n=1 Tax=Luteimonas sp. SDU82 TaxID=3422592 RepID=UPI003EBCF347